MKIQIPYFSHVFDSRSIIGLISHATGRQYFEITEDDFDLHMENAIRLNSELLFFCRQGSVSANRLFETGLWFIRLKIRRKMLLPTWLR